jgi:hypothetical protein
MALRNYEYRFELKPGKYVYVPDKQSKKIGDRIVSEVMKKWRPAEYMCHFGKKGGHLAALRPHTRNKFLASIDLRRFFESISRTKVHRSLMKIGFDSRRAFDIAEISCVSFGGRKFLPYGFVQSMALATLAIEKGLLGKVVGDCRLEGIFVTMYVDDIIMSSNSLIDLEVAYGRVISAIGEANLSVSGEKCSLPDLQVDAFNCTARNLNMELTRTRFDKFQSALIAASPRRRIAILRYVGVINAHQHSLLSIVT